jgi:DNA-directed RNA polymerase subunit RPC12/RpoP
MIVYDYYCKDCEKEYETILDHVPYECEHCGGYELTITWRVKAYD